jgi:hypothetical protein|tara:strand:- start:246 stop:491 length:246 start_codon:yes stop_codon:yes gene_type:complete
MDLGEIMRQQVENDSYTRWSTKYNTYIELSRWINSTLNKPGYNKLELGKDIMKHILEAMENSKHIMENTEMGKKMKEMDTE